MENIHLALRCILMYVIIMLTCKTDPSYEYTALRYAFEIESSYIAKCKLTLYFSNTCLSR